MISGRHGFQRCRTLLLLLIPILFLSVPVGAESFCDPNLLGDSKSPLTYKLREDRCEGFYAQQVSSTSLEVRSLVAGFDFDSARDAELALAWTAPPGVPGNVRIRAFSVKTLTYYRMDTAVPAARGMYRWPANILASQKLGQADLGLVARINVPGPGGATREVLLPLQAGAAAKKSETGYEVTIIPPVRLHEVRLTVSRVDAQGEPVATLRRDEELGYAYYPSGKPTVFSTGTLGPAGYYRLTIKAILKSGSSTEGEIELYHPGD